MLAATRLAGFGGRNGAPSYVGGQATFAGSASSINVPFPAGSRGQLLLAGVFTTNTLTHTTPAGWNLGFTASYGAGRLSVFDRIADDNSGSSLHVSFSGSGNNAAVGLRFAPVGWGVLAPIYGAAVTSSSTTAPDPPSVSMGRNKSMLALAICGYGLSLSAVVSGFPAGYGNPLDTGSTNNANVCCAMLPKNGGAEDPGAFTLPSSVPIVANTILIANGNGP